MQGFRCRDFGRAYNQFRAVDRRVSRLVNTVDSSDCEIADSFVIRRLPTLDILERQDERIADDFEFVQQRRVAFDVFPTIVAV